MTPTTTLRTALSRLARLADELRSRRDLYLPALFAIAGFTPIACLTLAIFELVPLHVTSLVLALPAYVVAIVAGARHRRYGRLAVRGFAIALIAVLLYDATRVPWIVTHFWSDFIPNIGAMVLNREQPDAVVGYAWRWLGNGGGMGVAFFMAYPLVARFIEVRRAALLFGVGVWSCLILTLLVAPHGQDIMFHLTPLTFVLSLVGHLVFGGTIGVLMHWSGLNVTAYEPDFSVWSLAPQPLHPGHAPAPPL